MEAELLKQRWYNVLPKPKSSVHTVMYLLNIFQ